MTCRIIPALETDQGTTRPTTRRIGQGLEEGAPLVEPVPAVNAALRKRAASARISALLSILYHAPSTGALVCYGTGMFGKLSALPITIMAASLALTGCSEGSDGYPSLAERPVERATSTPPMDTITPTPGVASSSASDHAAIPNDLAARLDHLVQEASSAHQTFADKQHAAETLVSAAGSAPAGSENWARATQALAIIESARAETAKPLGDIDRIDVDDRLAHAAQDGTSGDSASRPAMAAIGKARETVSAWVAEEDSVLTRLDGRLAR